MSREGFSLVELRELSERSRRTMRWAFVAACGALLLYPVGLALSSWLPGHWGYYASASFGGALLVKFAHVAGQERGAYRGLFRRVKARRSEATSDAG